MSYYLWFARKRNELLKYISILMKKKILITGAAGYIGSFLTTKLLTIGYEIIAIDNLSLSKNSLSHLFLNKNFSFIKGDVRDKKLISKVVKKVDYIIPLAAIVGAPLCDRDPFAARSVNFDAIIPIIPSFKLGS